MLDSSGFDHHVKAWYTKHSLGAFPTDGVHALVSQLRMLVMLLCVCITPTRSVIALYILGWVKNKGSALACAGFATIYISLVMQPFFACIKLLFAVMIGGACLSY